MKTYQHFPATCIFRQYTALGFLISAAGVEEVRVESQAQQEQVIKELQAKGWSLEAIWSDSAKGFI